MALGSSGSLSMYQLMTYTGTDDTYISGNHAISLLDPGIKSLYGNSNATQVDLLGLRGKSMSVTWSFTAGVYSVLSDGQADIWGLTIDLWQVLYAGTSSQSFNNSSTPTLLKYDLTHGYWSIYSFYTQSSPHGSNYYITAIVWAKRDSVALEQYGRFSGVRYNVVNYGWESLTITNSNGLGAVTITPQGTSTRIWDYKESFSNSLNYQYGGNNPAQASQEYWNVIAPSGGVVCTMVLRAIS
jgi:hypothetical protein